MIVSQFQIHPSLPCFVMPKQVPVNTSPLLARSYRLCQQRVLERLCKGQNKRQGFSFFFPPGVRFPLDHQQIWQVWGIVVSLNPPLQQDSPAPRSHVYPLLRGSEFQPLGRGGGEGGSFFLVSEVPSYALSQPRDRCCFLYLTTSLPPGISFYPF